MLIIKDRNTDHSNQRWASDFWPNYEETFVITWWPTAAFLHFHKATVEFYAIFSHLCCVFVIFFQCLPLYLSGFFLLCFKISVAIPATEIAATDDDLCLRNWFFDRIIPVCLYFVSERYWLCKEWVGAVKCNVLSCNLLIEMYVGMNDM